MAEAGIPGDSGAPSPLSYRDTSGVVVRSDSGIVRHVHPSYAAHFDALLSTGLYASLVERGQLVSVFVLENGVARTRLVTVGERLQDSIEVLSGLSAGEAVVAPVPAGLEDGARIEVRR